MLYRAGSSPCKFTGWNSIASHARIRALGRQAPDPLQLQFGNHARDQSQAWAVPPHWPVLSRRPGVISACWFVYRETPVIR